MEKGNVTRVLQDQTPPQLKSDEKDETDDDDADDYQKKRGDLSPPTKNHPTNLGCEIGIFFL